MLFTGLLYKIPKWAPWFRRGVQRSSHVNRGGAPRKWKPPLPSIKMHGPAAHQVSIKFMIQKCPSRCTFYCPSSYHHLDGLATVNLMPKQEAENESPYGRGPPQHNFLGQRRRIIQDLSEATSVAPLFRRVEPACNTEMH